jgi:hypothetical protein
MEQTKSGIQAFLEGRFNNVVSILLAGRGDARRLLNNCWSVEEL